MTTKPIHFIVFSGLSLFSASAFAANLYWDLDGVGAGSASPSGTWATSATTWSTDSTGVTATTALTTTAYDGLFFSAGTNATGSYTVTLGAAQSARSLTFEEGTVTLTGSALTLAGGGINVTGAGDAFISSNLTISGNNIINVGTSRNLTLSGGTFSRSAGATVNIQGAGVGSSTMTNLSGNVNDIIGPWASGTTSGGTTYAKFSGSNISGLGYAGSTDGTAAAGAANITDNTGAVNYTTSSTTGAATGAGASINTLRYSGSGLTISNTNLLVTKGIMNAGTGALIFSNAVTAGSGAIAGTSATEMVVNSATSDITFTGIFTGSITKTGSGTMTLGSTANSIDGITVNEGTLRGIVTGTSLTPTNPLGTSIIKLNGGTLGIQASATVDTTGQIVTFGNNVEVGSDATIDVRPPGTGTSTNKAMAMGTLTIGTSSLQVTNANVFRLSFVGATTLTGNATFNTSTSTTTILNLSAVGESGGPRSLIKSGAGILTLNGAGSFTGSTTVSEGTLSLGDINALQNTSGIALGGAAAATLQNSGDLSGIIVTAPITAANSGVTSTISYSRNTNGSGGGLLTLSGGITGGAGNVVFTTPNVNSGNQIQTILLGGNVGSAGNYGGTTTLGVGNTNNTLTLKSGIANALPTTTVLTFGQNSGTNSGRTTTFELNGNNQTLAGLSNGGTLPNLRAMTVNSTAAATLTINNATDFTFGGATISSSNLTRASIRGAISLVKNGAGTFTLGGTLAGGATAQGNTFTGSTQILGGILVLGETISIQNSAFDTGSILGDAYNGLRSSVTTLTLGGLTGINSFASRFTTNNGGYNGLTALTLNPFSSATYTYSGNITDGAAGMTLTKTGAGIQVLSGNNSYTGTTTVSGGTLALLGGSQASPITVTNGATLGFDIAAPTSSTNSVTLNAGHQIRVTGSPTLPSYTLLTTTATITGAIPNLNPAIPGYTLTVYGGNTLKLVVAPFANWISNPAFGLAVADQDLGDDPDGDGIGNGVENLFGTNPGAFTQGLLVGIKSGNTFTFTHPKNASPASDLTASYTWSKDLASFLASGATDGAGTTVAFTTQADTPSPGITTVTATVTGTDASKLFVRVNVTQP